MDHLGSTFNGKPQVKRAFLASVLAPKLALQSCLKVAHLYLPSLYGHTQLHMTKSMFPGSDAEASCQRGDHVITFI